MEELELSLNLDELQTILEAAREREDRNHRFMAAIQGIDLSNDETDTKARFDEAKRKAEAQLTGKSEAALEYDELGLDIEVED